MAASSWRITHHGLRLFIRLLLLSFLLAATMSTGPVAETSPSHVYLWCCTADFSALKLADIGWCARHVLRPFSSQHERPGGLPKLSSSGVYARWSERTSSDTCGENKKQL